MYWRSGLSFLCLSFSLASFAQQHEQLWMEWQTSYPFANRYLVENTISYQTVLSQQNKWRSYGVSPVFEYSLIPKLDLTSEVPVAHTLQKVGNNSVEASPLVGVRFYFTQNKKVDIRLIWRYQIRFFHKIEAEDWEISNRSRLRAEAYVSINGPNLFTDKLWYLFTDYEEFIVIDQQVDERFANRRRARIGLGYRLNYRNRFDLGYTWQSSRNEIDGDFISNDHVIQLKYKMFFNQTIQAGR